MTKLRDQELLDRLARTSQDSEVRRAAVGAMSDQDRLLALVLDADDFGVRQLAVAQLVDGQALVHVIVESGDEELQRSGLRRLTDQQLLLRLALRPDLDWVSSAAAQQMTDQSLLVEIAGNAENLRARECAAHAIMDLGMLEEAAMTGTHPDAGRTIVAELRRRAPGNLKSMERIATKAVAWSTRRLALYEVEDGAVIAAVADDDVDENVRQAAVRMLADQELLAQIAEKDPAPGVRAEALQRIDDPQEIVRLLENETATEARSSAYKSLRHDQLALATALARESDQSVRRENRKWLKDPLAVAEYAVRVVSADEAAHCVSELVVWTGPPLESTGNSAGAVLLRLLPAFAEVPEVHRDRLIAGTLLPVLDALSDPRVAVHLGDVVKVDATWRAISQEYDVVEAKQNQFLTDTDIRMRVMGGQGKKLTIKGEVFALAVVLTGREAPLQHSWETEFLKRWQAPGTEGMGDFKPSGATAVTLLQAAFADLPVSALYALAADHPRWQVRQAAIGLVDDDDVLIRILHEEPNYHIRLAAAERVRDKEALLELALHAEDSEIWGPILVKLTDPAMRIRFATEAVSPGCRRNAVSHAMSQESLAGIAIEDEDEGVSLAAVFYLWDPPLLERVADESKHAKTRDRARDSLKRRR